VRGAGKAGGKNLPALLAPPTLPALLGATVVHMPVAGSYISAAARWRSHIRTSSTQNMDFDMNLATDDVSVLNPG
jgi:hypothetical protein